MKIVVRRWWEWLRPVEVLLVLSEQEALWLNTPKQDQCYHLKYRSRGSEVTEWDGEEWKCP